MLSCSIGNIFVSDHAPVFLVMSSGVQHPRAQWRFPKHLIKDPKFKQYFIEQFNYFMTENDTPDMSPNLLWETAKAVIRGLTISFSVNLKKKQGAEHVAVQSEAALHYTFNFKSFILFCKEQKVCRIIIIVCHTHTETLHSSVCSRSLNVFTRDSPCPCTHSVANAPSAGWSWTVCTAR